MPPPPNSPGDSQITTYKPQSAFIRNFANALACDTAASNPIGNGTPYHRFRRCRAEAGESPAPRRPFDATPAKRIRYGH
jgi:hypothetical protein